MRFRALSGAVLSICVADVPGGAWAQPPSDQVIPLLALGVGANHITNQLRRDDPTAALTGLDAYVRYQAAAAVALSLRYEHLDDDGGLFGGVKQVLQETTVTAEHKVGDGLLIRGELRRDWTDTEFFPGRRSSDSPRRAQKTALLGLVWWVGGKKGAW